ncbi:MAG TPA: hypothetical protein VFU33_01445 [Gaiellaceae bacterium]|nr:hypothetical protein [Gaiellaceae bacterium]
MKDPAGAERRARRLLRWYPQAWRARYGEEFTQLLVDDIRERPHSWRRTLDVARSGLAARLEQGPLPRSRLAGAGLVLGAALAAAAALHATLDPNQQIRCPHGGNPQAACTIVPAHGWVNPAALGVSLLGFAAAVGVLLSPRLRRFAGAAASISVGAAAVVWVATYRQAIPVAGAGFLTYHRSPAWTTPEAALIAFAAVALALAVLGRRRSLSRWGLAAAVLVLGLAAAGAAVHVLGNPTVDCNIRGVPSGGISGIVCLRTPGPGWLNAAALALCALAAAGAAVMLAQAATSASRASSSGP